MLEYGKDSFLGQPFGTVKPEVLLSYGQGKGLFLSSILVRVFPATTGRSSFSASPAFGR